MDIFAGIDVFNVTGRVDILMDKINALVDKLPSPTYRMDLASLLVLCATLFLAQRKPALAHRSKPRDSKEPAGGRTGDDDAASQLPFLIVYCLVMAADWLQGPFLYSLYRDEHLVPPNLVSALFTVGFLSGAASGYSIGAIADRRGRKAACQFFCVAYAASCGLTMAPSLPLLFAGRVLGGVGTSLLFSVFESWMVTDFHVRGLEKKGGDLSRTFGTMSTLNSVVAIASGVASEWLVSATGTRKAPFAASAALLGVAFWLISAQWAENYGGSGTKIDNADKQKGAKLWAILSNPEILTLGLASTVFEGSMYLFVFYWTPALKAVQSSPGDLPYGIIFASFMASILASSLLFNAMMGKRAIKHSELMVAIMATANVCFFLFLRQRSEQAMFWLFCLYEASVGMYWPCMGYLKGRVIEDGIRAQVYGLLRIPLNLFVVASLLLTADGDAYQAVFSTCSKLLFVAFGALGITVFNREESPQH